MDVAQAITKLTKLVQREEDIVYESPGGGGQEFVDYGYLHWSLILQALQILKEAGFNSFRDFSEHLMHITDKGYVARLEHFTFHSLLPISSIVCPYLEIVISEDKFELIEADFKATYCIQKSSLEYFDDFFGSRGFNVQYSDMDNARAVLYRAEDNSYTKRKPDMEKFWLEITNFIKVVRQ